MPLRPGAQDFYQSTLGTSPGQPARPASGYPRGSFPPPRRTGSGLRHKLLVIGVPVLAVLIGVIVTGSVLIFGGSLSPKAYQAKVTPLHNEAVEAMNDLYDQIGSTKVEGDITESRKDMQAEISDVRDAAQKAQSEVTKLSAPQSELGLHQNLLDYYGEVQAYLDEASDAADYALDMTKILNEWDTAPYAMYQMDSAYSLADLMGLIEADMATHAVFIQRITALTVPASCADYHQAWLDFMNQTYNAIAQLDTAAATANIALAESVFDSLAQMQPPDKIGFEHCMKGVAGDYMDLTDTGEDLQKKVAAIQ